MTLQEIIEKIAALEARSTELLTKAESSTDAAEVAGFKAMLESDIMPEIENLRAARAQAERDEQFAGMKAHVTTLEKVVEDMRKPLPGFSIGSPSLDDTEGKAFKVYGAGVGEGERSFFADVKLANKGRGDALERLGDLVEGKAMTEGAITGHTNAGQYLVAPQVEREIVETREQDNVMRQLCSKLNVNTNAISLDQITLGTTAGWVAELATKPESTSIALASVSASVFTAAGLATISNQLLADSNPAVDRLVTADLAKRLVALEETAFLVGSGTAQPLGVLNTPGLQTSTVATTDVAALIAGILDAVMKVQSEHGEPSAIVMHPRTWTRIIMSQDAQGLYLIGGGNIADGPAFQNRSLLGYRVVLTNRMPTNLGTGTNESRVIVGDFSEALILDRQGITVDESPHVYFTSNQTVFRAEQRVGFTAARAPKAFCIVGGAGLANG